MESAIYAQNDELGSEFQGRIKLPFWEWHWHHPTEREREREGGSHAIFRGKCNKSTPKMWHTWQLW